MRLPDHLDTKGRFLLHLEIVLNEILRLSITEAADLDTPIEKAQHVGIR